jgi:hypothetical protein
MIIPKKTTQRKSNRPNDTKLWKVFSEYIRLRDSDENGYCKCFTCGLVRYWKDGDCGHGIGRQHWGTRYSEKNNHFQCKRCNGFEGGKREVYKQKMDEKYGKDTWALMEFQSRKVWKISDFDIDVMTDYYKKEVEKLKASKHLK